jgi:hypothetical protein
MTTDRLVRRTIRKALIERHGWDVVSRVSGWVDVRIPRASTSPGTFAGEVRKAVQLLGYEPEVTISAGFVRITTRETIEQRGRGGHGFTPSTPAPATRARR